MMASIDDIPLELLDQIAQIEPAIYAGLLAYPRFARSLTRGQIFDYMELAGYDCRVGEGFDGRFIIWTRNGLIHKTGGPAIIGEGGTLLRYIDDQCVDAWEPPSAD